MILTPRQIKEEGRMPTDEELTAFYEKLARDKHPDGSWMWSNEHIGVDFARTQLALEHIKPGMSVLEFGCCDGGMSQHFASAVGEGGHLTLLDISSTFVDRTKEFLIDAAPSIEVLVADARTFDTRRRYDIIAAMEILEHLPDPRRLIRNAYRLLRKNSGKILISVPSDWEDSLGEHVHDFVPSDIANIVGDATGLHVQVEEHGSIIFAVIDKKRKVKYVP